MKAGDVVCLKSNLYFNMSVELIDKEDFVHCCWFNEEGNLLRASFYKQSLEKTSPHVSPIVDTISEVILDFVRNYFY